MGSTGNVGARIMAAIEARKPSEREYGLRHKDAHKEVSITDLLTDLTPYIEAEIDAARVAMSNERIATADERTPETVLRAMLEAYTAASTEACCKYYRACDKQFVSGKNTDIVAVREAQLEARHANVRVDIVQYELARWLECEDDRDRFMVTHPLVRDDYEARLSGSGPLNSPPPET